MNVVLSGGFDPLHPGHLKMIEHARAIAGHKGRVTILVNNDYWLLAKKGYVVQPIGDRLKIVRSLRGVDEVIATSHTKDPEDMSVAEDLKWLINARATKDYRTQAFLNGGDRGKGNTPEDDLCHSLGVVTIYGVGGTEKYASSSEIIQRTCEKARVV